MAPEPPFVAAAGGGTLLRVRVTPRAGRSAIAGLRDGALLVRLAAAPVDGAANDALIALLAGLLDLPKRAVSVVRGHRGRDKQVRIDGMAPAAVAMRLTGDITRPQ
ncbi:MAG TPA: DUF167 domain-containing protein [Vicinamibacterales bacterium]|nr:DUF167 domain-containing protein [Vicinamibacterales bacterium]